MEEESLVKPSVAELAGKFKGQPLPICAGMDEPKPVRRRPPRSLHLSLNKEQTDGEKPASTSPHNPNAKQRNSAFIEKMQANLCLSPTALLPSPRSPGVKLLAPGPSPLSPCPPSALAVHKDSEEEAPASFEKPVKGAPLPSINKGRARLSIKRRPPTRSHRKSSDEEEVTGRGGETGLPSLPITQKYEEVFVEVKKEEAHVDGNKEEEDETQTNKEEEDETQTNKEKEDETQTKNESEGKPDKNQPQPRTSMERQERERPQRDYLKQVTLENPEDSKTD